MQPTDATSPQLAAHTCELFAVLSILAVLPETAKIQAEDARRITENLVSVSPTFQAMLPQINARVRQILEIAKTQQAIVDTRRA